MSVQQSEALVDFLEGHKELALGRCSRTKEGRSLSKRLWQECAEILNSVSSDCVQKTGEQWRVANLYQELGITHLLTYEVLQNLEDSPGFVPMEVEEQQFLEQPQVSSLRDCEPAAQSSLASREPSLDITEGQQTEPATSQTEPAASQTEPAASQTVQQPQQSPPRRRRRRRQQITGK
ncbi:uncharacterized protein LOC111355684 [Spodoptera litura]|uniref:Uncharacterized protein LOC111355684 n=1 Tax=Spodoptera litura TaxID=69820 RepID=A0A9J7IUH0_SPOLT|nr:uncharacterized protein LOC111355684 [Spodoptera litura]